METIAPTIGIVVEGHDVSAELSPFVVRCDVDLARDIADMITLIVANPSSDVLGRGYDGYTFTESKVLQPGNRVEVSFGYGGNNTFVGAGEITRWLPVFPDGGTPTLTIKAMDASRRLMHGSTLVTNPYEARIYHSDSYQIADVMAEIIGQHGLVPGEIDQVPQATGPLVKKRGMSDYQFVKGLANAYGYEFKIRWAPAKRRWVGHWRAPRSEQVYRYTFEYGVDKATLLSFQPQWNFDEAPTEVQVLARDEATGLWEELTVQGKAKEERRESALRYTGTLNEKLKEEIKSLTQFRLAAGGHSVEIVVGEPFSSAEQAEAFARSWFARRRDLFITARARTIGIETVRAGDVHTFTGIGTQLSGNWEITVCRHVFDRTQGYYCDITCNKVLEG